MDYGNSEILNIDKMTGTDFEKLCAEILSKNGFEKVELTPATGDHGIDITAWKNRKKYAIQCKRYSGNVGNKAVQEAYSGKRIYTAAEAIVITNSHFTKQATEEAEDLGVILWDRDKLIGQMELAGMEIKQIFTEKATSDRVAQAIADSKALLDIKPIDPDNMSLSEIRKKTEELNRFMLGPLYGTATVIHGAMAKEILFLLVDNAKKYIRQSFLTMDRKETPKTFRKKYDLTYEDGWVRKDGVLVLLLYTPSLEQKGCVYAFLVTQSLKNIYYRNRTLSSNIIFHDRVVMPRDSLGYQKDPSSIFIYEDTMVLFTDNIDAEDIRLQNVAAEAVMDVTKEKRSSEVWYALFSGKLKKVSMDVLQKKYGLPEEEARETIMSFGMSDYINEKGKVIAFGNPKIDTDKILGNVTKSLDYHKTLLEKIPGREHGLALRIMRNSWMFGHPHITPEYIMHCLESDNDTARRVLDELISNGLVSPEGDNLLDSGDGKKSPSEEDSDSIEELNPQIVKELDLKAEELEQRILARVYSPKDEKITFIGEDAKAIFRELDKVSEHKIIQYIQIASKKNIERIVKAAQGAMSPILPGSVAEIKDSDGSGMLECVYHCRVKNNDSLRIEFRLTYGLKDIHYADSNITVDKVTRIEINRVDAESVDEKSDIRTKGRETISLLKE